MKTKLFALMIAMFFMAFQSLEAKPKVLLRLNLEKGASYQMTMVMDNNINQEIMGQQMKVLQKMEMVTSYKVLDKLPDDNYVIEYSFLKMKMDMDANGQKVIIDSESSADDPASAIFKDMASFKMKFTITPMGKVLSVEGMEEIAKKFSSNPQLAQTLAMFTDEKSFKATFEQYFGYYPEKEVEVGSKWDFPIKMPALMNMEMQMSFEVADIADDEVVMNVISDMNLESPIERDGMKINMKMKGKQGGQMKVDRKTGMTGTMDMNQDFDMHMKFQNPQTGEDMEMPIKMNGVTKISVSKI